MYKQLESDFTKDKIEDGEIWIVDLMTAIFGDRTTARKIIKDEELEITLNKEPLPTRIDTDIEIQHSDVVGIRDHNVRIMLK